jgi:hypothetical protein
MPIISVQSSTFEPGQTLTGMIDDSDVSGL